MPLGLLQRLRHGPRTPSPTRDCGGLSQRGDPAGTRLMPRLSLGRLSRSDAPQPQPRQRDVTLKRSTPADGWGLRLRGLVLHAVTPDSPADRGGLAGLLGWRLCSVDGRPVRSHGELIAAASKGTSLRLQLQHEAAAEADADTQRQHDAEADASTGPACAPAHKQFEAKLVAAAAQAAADLLAGGDAAGAATCIRKSAVAHPTTRSRSCSPQHLGVLADVAAESGTTPRDSTGAASQRIVTLSDGCAPTADRPSPARRQSSYTDRGDAADRASPVGLGGFSPRRALSKLGSTLRTSSTRRASTPVSAPSPASGASPSAPSPTSPADDTADDARVALFDVLLGAGTAEEAPLRQAAWSGVPDQHRASVWRLLSGYTPWFGADRPAALSRKREEYRALVQRYWTDEAAEGGSIRETDQETRMRRQVTVDVPRTQPRVGFFRLQPVQDALRRLLFIWGLRHPASGYVQGMDGLAAPFFAVFFAEAAGVPLARVLSLSEEAAAAAFPSAELLRNGSVEADSYWCLSAMLDHVQDNYTDGQPGVQRSAAQVEATVGRVDAELHAHIKDTGCDFLRDITWRWTTCLLVRELPLLLVARLWDTYLAEGDSYPALHVYVCVAFLAHWRDRLLQMDFAELMVFLRKLDAQRPTRRNMESWLSTAYVYRERHPLPHDRSPLP